jgi:hypothetical protein
MDEPPKNPSVLRFRIITLLAAFVVVSLLLTIGISLYKWYHFVPTMPLADAVADFNARKFADPVGQDEPPLTETEVIKSIRSQLPLLHTFHSQLHKICSDIARTKRIPVTATLDGAYMIGDAPGYERQIDYRRIKLYIREKYSFSIIIRESNKPTAKPNAGNP